ncbi:MAG: L-aspartate oxidase [Elusimicrobia bacterium GWC2_65_9]|nr:MAG: L-aspartate oxidase [Elusimicrobia bacterium GWA2_66_18]OGR70198.1 MAG: L-aspartate oxidase [Elusimicrobia bacterium GWC2_65_9]
MDPRASRGGDFLVLGSGIAGLLSADKLSRLGRVTLVTKKDAAESNTNYAQGGIAAVMSELDTFAAHGRDTLVAGAGLCDESIVRLTVAEAPRRVRELQAMGVRFSQRESIVDLGLEAGHSHRRILHAGDITGREIERALVASVRRNRRVTIVENHLAVDLILDPERACRGAYVMDRRTGRIEPFSAGATVLATGGAGKVYLYTTNPDIATGDGMAMAWRAGAAMANMEFVQFHPTCLYHPQAKSFLLSEALRGEGGQLILKNGARFMPRYHRRRELAPRDIVARAIDSELKRTGDECVFLDMTHLRRKFLKARFPNIYARVLSFDIDMAERPIPVVPAAHFFCGGVRTDAWARTSVARLFAVGETACTGLHGANRLASNSLLEACVFAHRLAEHLASPGAIKSSSAFRPKPWNPGQAVTSDEAVVVSQNWDEIRSLMWNYVGIVRTDKRLARALSRMELLNREIAAYYWDFLPTPDMVELRNIADVATLVIKSALRRKESRGLHYTLDYPRRRQSCRRDTVLRRAPGRR